MSTNTWPESDVADWYDPFDPQQMGDASNVWSRLRESGPLFRSARLGAWFAPGYDVSKRIYLDSENFSNAGISTPLAPPPADVQAILDQVPTSNEMDLLTSDPPRHSRLRAVLRQGFQSRRIARLEGDIRALAHRLIDGFERDGHCDFYSSFAYPFPLSVICALLGVPTEDLARLNRWGLSNVQLRWGSLDHAGHLAAAQDRVDFYRYAEDLVAERRASPGEDLISEIVQASDASDAPLREMELAGMVMTCVTAGHETSANYLTLSMYNLLKRPELWESIKSRRDLIPAAVNELFRYTAPAQVNWRRVARDVDLDGVELRIGDRVAVMIGSSNHDPRAFSDPEEIDFERAETSVGLAFGNGIHACVGAPLARLEGRVALEVLTERLPSLRLAGPEPLTFKPNIVLRCPSSLHVVWAD